VQQPEAEVAVPPGDFDLFSKVVEIRVKDADGVKSIGLTVEEMVLAQRDAFTAYLTETLSAEDVEPLIGKFMVEGEGGATMADIVKLVFALGMRIGNGWLSGLLAIALDLPENLDVIKAAGRRVPEKVHERDRLLTWVRANVRLRDEVKLLQAFFEMNDLMAYLKNVASLLPVTLQFQQEGEAAKKGTMGQGSQE
jgi:hypothetical protein